MKKILIFAAMLCVSSLLANEGESLYKTCATCHGAKGDKAALNKSQIIAGWSVENTIAALTGYKNGTYGGPLKGTMAGQVKNLDDAKIAALAQYISKLK